MKTRSWYPLVRTAALALGVLALAGCATGYSLVQPEAAASGSYYTSNGPYGGGYYDDDAGGYYTGAYAAPYVGYGSFGGYYGFGGFGYGYPWYGAGPTFGLGLGSLCGWSCAGFYGYPFYPLGFGYGYPLGWGTYGHRHHHRGHYYGHGGHYAGWNGTWQHRHDGNRRHPWNTRRPGIEVEGRAAPADFAARRVLPSAAFAPARRMPERAFATLPSAHMAELVGPPAVGPGIEGAAAFSRPAAMPMMQQMQAPRFSSPAAMPMMRSAAPRSFAAPTMRAMPMMRSAPMMPTPSRATPSIHVR